MILMGCLSWGYLTPNPNQNGVSIKKNWVIWKRLQP